MPCTQKGEKCGRMFEKASLAAPPAGFEPAHTAPEAVGAQCCELQKHFSAPVFGPRVDRAAVLSAWESDRSRPTATLTWEADLPPVTVTAPRRPHLIARRLRPQRAGW